VLSDIIVAQQRNSSSKTIIDAIETIDVEPSRDVISAWSSISMALWTQRNRLSTKDGELCREYIDVQSGSTHSQVVIPHFLRHELLRAIHSGIEVADLSRRSYPSTRLLGGLDE